MVLTLLADDLTGACEVAALGFRRGLPTVVALQIGAAPPAGGLQVIDSETRLRDPADAAAQIRTLAAGISPQRPLRLFKKIDSALRGPVNAEITALAEVLGLPRALVVPANPALGRLVRGGRYTIADVPLDETEFAQDPLHPARSADVRELLASPGHFSVHTAAPDERLPSAGLIVGDTATSADLAEWAARLPDDALPAGGAAFCEALLERWHGPGKVVRTEQPRAEDFPGDTLLVSGTLSAAQRQLLHLSRTEGQPTACRPADALDEAGVTALENELVALLQHQGRACLFAEAATVPGMARPESVSAALGQVVCGVLRQRSVGHLVIEGGATAAAIAHCLGWTQLQVVAEWAPGTVTLRPTAPGAPVLTLKPGSYPWPSDLQRLLFHPSNPAQLS